VTHTYLQQTVTTLATTSKLAWLKEYPR